MFWKYVCVFHLCKVFGNIKISYPFTNFCGDTQMWQKARVLTLISVLTSSAVG
jgi:hypothetical protein